MQSITHQFKRRLPANVDAEELRSVALTGLVAAARNFRSAESSSFAGYASSPAVPAKWMDQARPVNFVSLDVTSEHPGTGKHSLHELIPDDYSVTAIEALERKELAQLVGDRLAELPGPIRRVLAIYYYEGMAEIARVLGLTESRVCQIHAQAVTGCASFFWPH